ncbi:MAG: hypothetical protein M1837_002481 [Sclerophora amabilis]|nr:MAG: hypothetical protein M1837_002481 [Sclerophora amabilis]
MATPRLSFLYPFLHRSIRGYEPSATHSPAQCFKSLSARRCKFHNHARFSAEYQRRHGAAVEPPSQLEGGKAIAPSHASKKEPGDKKEFNDQKDALARSSQSTTKTTPKKNADASSDQSNLQNPSQASEAQPEALSQPPQVNGESKSDPRDFDLDIQKPLDRVLHMDPPSASNSSESQKPPHLQAPPYVHHFDTYTLVREVQRGGFTQDQSVTAMKAVRSLLASNLEMAREGLVSKSDVENLIKETYLFRAACSELRTEIQNNRKAETDKMRTERGQLQHEVDILNQKLTQELLTLKDELRGMFNDRRMAVRMEQRAMESSIQELNYKITVSLNSDMKSEVEGLRWVLTRRAAMAIGIMAFLILGSLRYSSYQIHSHADPHNKPPSASSSSSDPPYSSTAPTSQQQGRESAEVLANFAMAHESDAHGDSGGRGVGGRGGGPSYVSLG